MTDILELLHQYHKEWGDDPLGRVFAMAADEIERLRKTLREKSLPIDRETLGRMVREAWMRWAQTQPNPKTSWLVPYDDLAEPDKEVDRQIGEAICKWTTIHCEARAALRKGEPR